MLLQDALDSMVKRDMKSNREEVQHAVLAVDYVLKESMYGFFFFSPFPVLRPSITTTKKAITKCKRAASFLVTLANTLINTLITQ